MIPALIGSYLRDRYPGLTCAIRPADGGDAAAPDRTGDAPGLRTAKVVILRLGGSLAMAVVTSSDRVNLAPIEECTGLRAEVASGDELAARFHPCEPGATVPLALFGVPIYADAVLLRTVRIRFPAGTHAEVAEVETGTWTWSERVLPIANLGRRARRRWRVGEPAPRAP